MSTRFVYENFASAAADLPAWATRNKAYRRVIYTDSYVQLVLMSVANFVPLETHRYATQLITVHKGTASVLVGAERFLLQANQTAVVPPGTEHRIDNANPDERLQLAVVYSPPQHQRNVVDFQQPTEEDEE